MPVARAEPPETRVIAHVDLDCFYVQVEQRRHPELKGNPTAVVMYNPWKGGGIIAVGYEARAAGVTRNMRGDDARKVCPEINLIQVPTHYGKADLTDYRDAGSEVVAVFSRGGICERASIDEVYLDVTAAAVERLQKSPPDTVKDLSPQVLGTHIVRIEQDLNGRMEVKDWLCRSALFASRGDQLLACGAMIIAELRTAVYEETRFTTSAGIAHNKMLAKLASGMHKPAQQTLIPSSGAPGLLASLPIKKLKGLGGKLGKAVESDLGIEKVGDLLPYSESKLQDLYGTNTGTWLWRASRGMSGDEVEDRTLPKSHGCGKTFPGPKALKDLDSVSHWLSELSGELQERLDADLQQNNRSAKLLVCHAACYLERKGDNQGRPFPSKSCAIRYGKDKIAHDALILFKRALSDFCPHAKSLSPAKGEKAGSGCSWGVTGLSLSANNIVDASGTAPITQYFAAPASTTHAATAGDPVSVTTPPSSPSSLRSSSLVSLYAVEDSAQQVKFGEPSQLKDNTGSEDVEVTASFGMESGALRSSSAEGVDLPCRDSGTDLTEAPVSSHETFQVVSTSRTQTNFLTSDDDNSRHTQSYTDKGMAVHRPRNGAFSAEESETDPLCTPKFGVPGRPAGSLTPLEFPEEASTVCSSDSPLVQSTVESSSRQCETVTEAEVITCSPLEQGVVQITPQDSDSVPGREVPKSVSTLVENHSKTAILGSSLPRSVQKSKVDDGSRGVAPASSSKRLVFQRVDDLWENSRPNTQPSLNAKSSIVSWSYKEDEIDEGVLSELPEEIQQELRNQLRLKRPKTGSRSTISDFFKTNSSTTK
ncbi:unnamed protein product [Calypogeia fissa]